MSKAPLATRRKKIASDQVKWGMIGTGDVTERKSGPAFNKINQSTLAAVTNRTFSKAQDYAHRHQVPAVYATVDELLADPDLNVIYVATPPSSHHELAVKIAGAGKACYVEKPMALTYEECTEMNEAFSIADRPLYVAYYRRALPNFLKVKELLQEGTIGKIHSVHITLMQLQNPSLVANSEVNWRVDPNIAGGGYFYDLGSHQFDLLEFLLGPIERIDGLKTRQEAKYNAADTVVAQWQFESGILGLGYWNFHASQNQERIEIHGSKGTLTFPCFGSASVYLQRDQENIDFSFTFPENIQQPLIQTVVDDLLGKGICPSTGQTGARASQLLEQIQSV